MIITGEYVFNKPKLDEMNNIIGNTQICESIHTLIRVRNINFVYSNIFLFYFKNYNLS